MIKLFQVHKYFTINQPVSSAVYRNQPNSEYQLYDIKLNGLAPSATRRGNAFYSIQTLSLIAGAAIAGAAIAGAAIAGAEIAGAAYVAPAGVATAT